jgi:hypothetical protein
VSTQQQHESARTEAVDLHALLRFCDPATLPPLSFAASERILDQVLAKMEARSRRAQRTRMVRLLAVLGSLLLVRTLLFRLAR